MEKYLGVRDLSNEEYKIYLSKKYGIVKDELLGKYETENKFFDSLDNTLRHAHALEVSNFFEAACPNCDSIISSNDLECPICKASFGANSSWRLSPITREEAKPHGNQKHKEIKGNGANSELTQEVNGKEMSFFLLTILLILAVPFVIYGLSGSSLFNPTSSVVEKSSSVQGVLTESSTCEQKIKEKFQFTYTDKYGNTESVNVDRVALIAAYVPGAHKFGNNSVRYYNVFYNQVEKGRSMGISVKRVYCVINLSGNILGIEDD